MVVECWHLPVYHLFSHGASVLCHFCWWQARWRQLRSCAGTLKSIIWAYRTRVAPFGAHCNNADHDSAECELRQALINWREKLAAGADLNTTTLRRHFSPRVFKHGQRPPPAVPFIQWCWRHSLLHRLWKRHNARKAVRACGRDDRSSEAQNLSICPPRPGENDEEGGDRHYARSLLCDPPDPARPARPARVARESHCLLISNSLE